MLFSSPKMDYIEQNCSLSERFGILLSYSWKHWLGSFSKAGGLSMKQLIRKLWVPMCPSLCQTPRQEQDSGQDCREAEFSPCQGIFPDKRIDHKISGSEPNAAAQPIHSTLGVSLTIFLLSACLDSLWGPHYYPLSKTQVRKR